ncbi:prepro-urotensin II-beta isoform X2 [Trichomycterus rosablanca]|uniref:prepro-urotensin II-beta isoform X2 n=1 Tax=Trichomycterus rosablanca TaxID=2290929 RepID=UPI002F35FD2C
MEKGLVMSLRALEPLLAHPLTHSAGMSYPGPVSEEEQLMSPGERTYSEQAHLSEGMEGLAYPSLFTGDVNREGLRSGDFVPSQLVKEVLLEKPFLNQLSRFLGGRKQYRKRAGNTECFWKYCV